MEAGRYRKKPVVVDAMCVAEIIALGIREGPGGMPEWLVQALSIDPETNEGYGGVSRLRTLPPSRGAIEVRTKQGQLVVAESNEWIVCAAADDLWPVAPDVFEATYVAAEDEEPALTIGRDEIAELSEKGEVTLGFVDGSKATLVIPEEEMP